LGGVSDHSPILFEMAPDPKKPPIHLKFNSTWKEDQGYLDLVKDSWVLHNVDMLEPPPLQFLENLKRIKKETIAWHKEQKQK
jgi:hypothetical protein